MKNLSVFIKRRVDNFEWTFHLFEIDLVLKNRDWLGSWLNRLLPFPLGPREKADPITPCENPNLAHLYMPIIISIPRIVWLAFLNIILSSPSWLMKFLLASPTSKHSPHHFSQMEENFFSKNISIWKCREICLYNDNISNVVGKK